jgi:hypothetical protein
MSKQFKTPFMLPPSPAPGQRGRTGAASAPVAKNPSLSTFLSHTDLVLSHPTSSVTNLSALAAAVMFSSVVISQPATKLPSKFFADLKNQSTISCFFAGRSTFTEL